jgi:hypothetical protein
MSFNTSLVPVNRKKSGIDKQALNLAAKAKLNANAKEFQSEANGTSERIYLRDRGAQC